VNLSSRQLQHKDFERSVSRILVDGAIDPHHIELEITESILMRNPEHAAQVLESLKTLGLQLSVDDFGTGYSSLSYLKRFRWIPSRSIAPSYKILTTTRAMQPLCRQSSLCPKR